MNDFKGLSRDTSWLKTPSDMWYFARNILLTSQYLSIANEKGNEYGYDIPGRVIGYAATNEDIVYFSIDGSYSCIGYVNYLNEVYVPVLRTMNPNFKFKPSCPIEVVSSYNYKKELIVVFSDGINKDSSSPKLINIHKPQITLTTSKEFIDEDDYTMFELFSPISLPSVYFDYKGGNLRAEVVHLAFCYVFDDDTESIISPILNTAYPSFAGKNTKRHQILYNLNNLSSNFTKIKLFFVINYDGATNGYASPIINISDYTTYILDSVENLDIVPSEQILISSARFDKIKTITKVDHQLLIGNVEQKSIENYQKYANNIVLNLKRLTHKEDIEKYKTHPTLLPDEVYSFKIVPIYKDSTKGNALHIPGRLPVGNENQVMSNQELDDIGLMYEEFYNKNYKRFHFENTGSVSEFYCDFGYWENEDIYPDKDYYNSTSIGGSDLRGKPVRYHRIPAITMEQFNHAQASGEIEESLGYMPKLFVEVANFEQAFPLEVRNLLQGYELIIEKRQLGGTYIETNGFLYTMRALLGATRNTGGHHMSINVPYQFPNSFTDSWFVSAETAKDNFDITSSLVKCYYGVARDKELNEHCKTEGDYINGLDPIISFPAPILSNSKLGIIVSANYQLPNNIASANRFGSYNLALKLKEKHPNKRYAGPHDLQFDPTVEGYHDIDDFVPLLPNFNYRRDLNIIYASLITLNKNIYNLEYANEFISLGIILTNTESNSLLVAGDVFTTNVINKTFTGTYFVLDGTYNLERGGYLYNILLYNLFNMYSPFSNHYIENGIAYKNYFRRGLNDEPWGDNMYRSWDTEDINRLNGFNYATVVRVKPVSSYFNIYVEALPPGLTERYVSYFPYRVYRGLDVQSESLQTNNLRFFPTNSYYDMPNDRGEIIALRGLNRSVYIQQRWSLYQSSITDKISDNETEVYLGSSTLFDRRPEEVITNGDKGYIGSNSQFACFVFRDGYITIDEESGKIFIINSDFTEASQRNMTNSFREILPLGNHYIKKNLLNQATKTDNPFLSVGYIVGFDKDNNRILVTKKYYNPKTLTRLMDFDGEFYRDSNGNILDFEDTSYFYNESRTFSFALDSKTWVCEHDYFPNAYLYNNKGFYGIMNKVNEDSKFYKFNSKRVNPGNYFGIQHESYVDLIFNTRLDLSKQYQAVNWVSESKDVDTNQLLQFKTIDKIMVYNYHQCSGIIDIKNNNFDNTRDSTARNTESQWKFNEFRDMLINPEQKFLKDDGTYISNSVALNKIWFEKNMFIGNFVVTRLIWSNQDNRITYVHNVQVKSVNSSR